MASNIGRFDLVAGHFLNVAPSCNTSLMGLEFGIVSVCGRVKTREPGEKAS